MTRFDTDLASRGWALIAEGATMISLAYAAAEQPAAEVSAPLPSALADDLPPLDEYGNELSAETTAQPTLKPQVDAGLGKCPVHGVAWTIKAGGVSKAGKPFNAFWKCSERDANGFCNQKPQRIWQDIHPIPAGVAA